VRRRRTGRRGRRRMFEGEFKRGSEAVCSEWQQSGQGTTSRKEQEEEEML